MMQQARNHDDFSRAETAAEFVLARTRHRPRIALVLGSGLGGFADSLKDATGIPYADIPGFPQTSAIGHAGRLVIGTSAGVALAAMQGRAHFYEGHPMRDITFPMRVFGRMGVGAVVLTNAAGGINLNYGQGALVVMSDHINLQGTSPLVGPNDERFGPRFPDMSQAYDRNYRRFAQEEGRRLGMEIHEGVYAALHGPQYETPAEIRFLRTIGADLVGMSTVPEVIVARHMGMKVLAISCVTNMAAGILDQPLNHEEVLETGRRVQAQFVALLEAVIPRIAADVGN
ncbi:MAG TPA: purine-nucleoside phosphorylase [Terriglobales bacterium]|nr:purine-nucleoside phosphorylase [Terriglobales bacterium]